MRPSRLRFFALFLMFSGLLASATLARANDSAFDGVGGSARPTRGENKAIRMVRETVVLTASATTYATRADFVFRNDSATAQNVQMGFPEGNSGEEALAKTSFIGFRTLVDDAPVAARRTVLKEWDSSGFDVYWVKTVAFKPRQTRRVRVEFASPYGGSTSWGFTRGMVYVFTGGNWRGKVDESALEVRVSQPGLWRILARNDKDGTVPFTLTMTAPNVKPAGAVLRHVWKNWEAQESVTIGLERAQSFWRLDSGGPDNSDFTLQSVAASQTFRVGARPTTIEKSSGFPPMGLTRNDVFYVEAAHLSDRFGVWGEAQKPPVKSEFRRGGNNSFALISGKTRIDGHIGESSARVNGKTIALGAPILSVPHSDSSFVFLPLAPIAKTLGLRVSFQGERLFRLERGSWRG